MDRNAVGRAGEMIAARFLRSRGVAVLACRLRVGRGELDLVGDVGGERVAFEVRTTASGEPLDAFGTDKYDQVWSLAVRTGCRRVDLVAVRLQTDGAIIRWVPGVSRG